MMLYLRTGLSPEKYGLEESDRVPHEESGSEA